jgi:hypothetical protein
MSGFDFAEWRNTTSRLAARIPDGFEEKFGYPPDDHEIAGPTDASIIDETIRDHSGSIPEVLLELYREIGEVSLPDLHVGYFIHPLERVVDGLGVGGDPLRMGGSWNVPIVVFGSDGGGAMFALGMPSGSPVYMLPEGPVRDQIYVDRMQPARVVADDLGGFLAKLKASIEAFLAGDIEGSRYI